MRAVPENTIEHDANEEPRFARLNRLRNSEPVHSPKWRTFHFLMICAFIAANIQWKWGMPAGAVGVMGGLFSLYLSAIIVAV